MLTFLIQGATGLARMFVETTWGKNLGYLFGGYEAARTIHIYVGIIMLCGLALHIIYLMFKINWRNFPFSLFGPDSLLFGLKDVKDFFQHIAWFFGIKEAPQFDRWGYWEKFDYFAVFWGIIILGGTGLLLTWQIAACRIMPGWGLNVAIWVHRIEAILAMAHVFLIHFFIGHLRPSSFPMNEGMFSGSITIEEAKEEKPAWIERIKKDGKLELAMAKPPARWYRVIYFIFGYSALAFGVYLLINGIVYSRYITLH